MPSVFTIEGTSRSRSRHRKSGGSTARLGDCKTFTNPRTGKTQQTCFVGKSKSSPTGWRIQKSATSASTTNRRR